MFCMPSALTQFPAPSQTSLLLTQRLTPMSQRYELQDFSRFSRVCMLPQVCAQLYACTQHLHSKEYSVAFQCPLQTSHSTAFPWNFWRAYYLLYMLFISSMFNNCLWLFCDIQELHLIVFNKCLRKKTVYTELNSSAVYR